MKITAKFTYTIACSALIFVSIGHTFTYLLGPKDPTKLAFMELFKAQTVEVLGSESSLFLFHEGFSLMMGLLLFGFGFVNLLFMRVAKDMHKLSTLILVNSLISITALGLSIYYFFNVPIICTGIAAIGFSLSFVLIKREIKMVK